MLASWKHELLKLRKRPATWALGAILLTAVLADYAFAYLALGQPASTGLDPQVRRSFEPLVLPENLLARVVPIAGSLGGAIALMLGAMSAGSEYGWGTLKTVLTQGPGRGQVLGGKLLGLITALAIYGLAALGMGAVMSLLVASALDLPVAWPSAWGLLRGLGAAWLLLGTMALLGYALATLFESTALAVGLGLVYLFVVEQLFASLAGSVRSLEIIRRAMPGPNADALETAFGPSGAGSPAISATQGAFALGGLAAAFALVSALALSRKDVA
jgi:ABC-type transport system involved in multi-copper enzyme maturation permease subunit